MISSQVVHDWLRDHAPDIAECAVDTQRGIAFVVPNSSSGGQKMKAAAQGDCSLRVVKNIPVTSDGSPDFELLSQSPRIDFETARRCEDALGPDAQAVAVVRECFETAPLLLDRDEFQTSVARPGIAPAPRRVAGVADQQLPPAYAAGPALEWSDPQHATLVDALRSVARGSGGITYVEDGRERFESYGEILAAARQVLHGLQQLGLKKGDPLPLQVTDRQAHFHVFWACALGGIVPVTIAVPGRYESNNPVVQKLLGVARLLEARHVMADATNVEPLRKLVPGDVRVHDVADLDCSQDGTEASIAPDDVVFYQLTSGSTGTPKCIPETHAAVISHIKHSTVDVGYTPDDRTLNWLPFDHVVPMLTFHMKGVYLGCHAVEVPTAEVLSQPLRWLELMEQHRINYSWSPNFGFKLVASAIKKAQADGGTPVTWDLGCLKKLMNAGEQVTEGVCNDFLRLAGLSAEVMQPAFGMAEVATCMTYANDYGSGRGVSVHRVLKSTLQDVLEEADDDVPDSESLALVDLGPPSPGVEIRITQGATDKVLSERRVGHLQIRGPCVMQGYFNNPQANADSCLPDGWFDSGDLGYIADGRLVLTGRAKEMIIVRGANFYAYEIEDAVAELEGCTPAFVAATSILSETSGTEALLLFFVPDSGVVPAVALSNLSQGLLVPTLRQIVARIHSQVASAFGVNPAYVIPVAESEFHKTTSGKIQRAKFKQEFLAGVYKAPCATLRRGLQQEGHCVPDWFCRPVWQRRQAGLEIADAGATSLLVFQPSEGDLATPLSAAEAIEFEVSPREALRDFVGWPSDHPLRVVYARPCSPAPAADPGKYYRELIELGQLLADAPSDVELYVVTAGALAVLDDDTVCPEYLAQTACLIGILKALAAELPQLTRSVQIDVDAHLTRQPADFAAVLDEEMHSHAADQTVAIRGGVRYVRRYAKSGAALACEVTSSATNSGYFRPGAAYLVTGGLGEIGRDVVRMILNEEDTSVLILGRRSDGDQRLQQLGWAGGSRVAYGAVDLGADQRALQQSVQEFLDRCGKPLAGVVHLAGHYERRPVSELNERDFAEAIKAKVEGSIHLHRVLKSVYPPGTTPTFLHFGSVSSFFAGQGLAAYCGACAFQEEFARFQRDDDVDSRVFVWSAWEDTGIAARDRTLGFAPWVCPIRKTQGLFVLEMLLNHTTAPAVCIGVNVQHPDFARHSVERDELCFDSLCVFYDRGECIDVARIQSVVTNPKYIAVPQLPRCPTGEIDREKLAHASIKSLTSTERSGPRNEVEAKLFEIWKEVLGLHDLGREDNFFELGGDSLLWMDMILRCNKAFGLKLRAMRVMEHGTIAELAGHVEAVGDASREGAPSGGRAPNLLVTLKTGALSTAPPVFLFPTVAGTTACFNELLSHMRSRRPMIGLTDPYLMGDRQSRLLPFDGWMQRYADAIQSRQPSGPYTLLSYSQGSTWLWGTADQLIRRGETVERCILLDPFFPAWRGSADGIAWLAAWYQAIFRGLPKFLLRPIVALSFKSMYSIHLPMATERQRELSLAKAYQRFTHYRENVWLLPIFTELDAGIRALDHYQELKRYPRDEYEDTVDFVCRKCAEKVGEGIEVDYLKDVMYVMSCAFLRAAEYEPCVLPESTAVTVVAPYRKGFNLSRETKLDTLVVPDRLEQIDVPLEPYDRHRHVTARLKGFYPFIEAHYRCMHDPNFIAKSLEVLQQAGVAEP